MSIEITLLIIVCQTPPQRMPIDYFAYFDKLMQQSNLPVRTAEDIRRRESEKRVAKSTVIPHRYHDVF